MQGRMNAIMVTVEPPISDSIAPNFGTASAMPSTKRNIAVRRIIRLQPNPKCNNKHINANATILVYKNRQEFYITDILQCQAFTVDAIYNSM